MVNVNHRFYPKSYFATLNHRFFQFTENHCRFFGHTVDKLVITFFTFKMFAGNIQSSQDQNCFSIDITRFSFKLRLNLLTASSKCAATFFASGIPDSV
jgi:hypothetical protein